MKTLILNGSPRRGGDTAALIAGIQKGLFGEVRVISPQEDGIGPCTDCRACWKRTGCALQDGMQEVYPFLEKCDNIVLASPIWFSQLSGPLMNLASRMQTYFAGSFFRQEPLPLRPKHGVVLLCGAEPGTERPALQTARTILKHMRALPCVAVVASMSNNQRPAATDQEALDKAAWAGRLLGQLHRQRTNSEP